MRYGIPKSAAVVRVRYTQFDHSEQMYFSRVESRMLAWCKAGKGVVIVNGAAYDVRTDDYMFLPWGHSIEYHADADEPFLMAGIHIIPRCALDRPIDYWVAHYPKDRLANCPWRQDAELPGLENVITGSFGWNVALGHLAEYVVQCLLYGEREDSVARLMAQLLLNEVHRSLNATIPNLQGLPSELQRLLRYLRDHIERPISLHELTEFSGLSRSTIGRLFRRRLRCTPGEWMLRQRMDEAKRFLSATRLPVGEVGRKLGIEDQFYFSKLFKKECGMAPTEYRIAQGMLRARTPASGEAAGISRPRRKRVRRSTRLQ